MIAGDREKITGDTQDVLRRKLALSGVANSDLQTLALMDRGLSAGVRSDILPVGLKKDGSFTSASRVFSTEDFALASGYVGRTIRTFGSRIRNGEIAVSPYRYADRTACDYCSYRGVCGFDRRIPGYALRDLAAVDGEEALRRMREISERASGADAEEHVHG